MGVKRDHIIPHAATGRILENVGAKRVSDEARAEFARVLEEIAEKIAIHAVQMAKHAGRKTVKEEDIRIAAK